MILVKSNFFTNNHTSKIIYPILLALAALPLSGLAAGSQSTSAFLQSELDPVVEQRIDKIIGSMTLEEKIGQMSLRDWVDNFAGVIFCEKVTFNQNHNFNSYL